MESLTYLRIRESSQRSTSMAVIESRSQDIMTGGIGGVLPIEKRLLGLDHDVRTIQRVDLCPPLSRGTSFITVMQPSHLRNGDDLAATHDGPWLGSILG